MSELEFFNKCNLCGSQEIQRVTQLRGKEKYLERCQRCSLVFLNREEREKVVDFCRGREASTETSPSFRQSHTDFFEDFFRKCRLKPGKVLDLGCGIGLFLLLAREKGWEVQGVEVSRLAAEMARSHYGLPVREGGIEGVSFPEETFDLVTLWNVLDFLSDPKGVLQNVHRFLKKGGVVVIRVTNIRFHLAVYRLWDLIDPQRGRENYPATFHAHNFSETTLKQILMQSGFRRICIRNSKTITADPHRAVSLAKAVVAGVSTVLFYGTLGRFCFSSSLIAQAQRD